MINVYGIYRGDECLYVGVTARSANVRFNEHKKDLANGKHINKALQKEYNLDNGKSFDYRVLDTINTDNTLLKYFYESLYISLKKPKTNKCIIEQGRNRIILQRCEPEVASKLIDNINEIMGE